MHVKFLTRPLLPPDGSAFGWQGPPQLTDQLPQPAATRDLVNQHGECHGSGPWRHVNDRDRRPCHSLAVGTPHAQIGTGYAFAKHSPSGPLEGRGHASDGRAPRGWPAGQTRRSKRRPSLPSPSGPGPPTRFTCRYPGSAQGPKSDSRPPPAPSPRPQGPITRARLQGNALPPDVSATASGSHQPSIVDKSDLTFRGQSFTR